MSLTGQLVEYTPGSYLQSDLDIFAKNFSTGLQGISPTLVSIDEGNFTSSSQPRAADQVELGDIQTSNESFTTTEKLTSTSSMA